MAALNGSSLATHDDPWIPQSPSNVVPDWEYSFITCFWDALNKLVERLKFK